MNLLPSVPLLSAAEAAVCEERLFAGDETKEWTAMEAAGAAVASGVEQDFCELGAFPLAANVLVLVGKGHNGADALIAAGRLLRAHPGARADVVFVFGARALRPLAARAWQQLQHAAGERVRVLSASTLEAEVTWPRDVALDGVFGLQFRPPLPPEAAAVLRLANRMPIRLRAAVDLPSGWEGEGAFRADFTYATGIVKREALAGANAGRVRYLDLGFFAGRDDESAADRVLTGKVLEPLRTLRPSRADKRTFGHVAIIGGSRSYPGAILMNTLAALHSGVGLVTVFVPQSLAAAYAARAPEAMWVGCPETPQGGLALEARAMIVAKLPRATAIAVGSGLDREEETLALVRTLLSDCKIPVLLDGDALQPALIEALRGVSLVLTPHAGEFARIAGPEGDLRKYCQDTGAAVALKGPVTRICGGGASSLVVYHALSGGPVLARGGSGDLLAGLMAGQLALLAAESPQSREKRMGTMRSTIGVGGAHGPHALVDALTVMAAARAVVWHGMAADALARRRGQLAVAITELVTMLALVLRGEDDPRVEN